ncbi:23S rRNA (pseudouridine(1915)-N(3))-methyltransferase RlmH [Fusibacter sp. 3D3]|uniref:23S rRNA (pseudouridine(1915)-N(3))-methyltransferase RlmH n=1 Tax=Fusibacter sp. 3D3 TaxID=1048380 RepID=UPI0008534E01|nr:23S rRNA (pseudouridine(1915)-N(3))-methyltransferase RlmH [Fusibacter sp. 3D3]GAU76406.1 large subunit m3Psi1915 methyltransferase RlmH [Fusibacter sp. 3D3]
MRITLITVGKIKEKYFMGAIDEYAKRLTKYCSLQMIEVPDEKAPEILSEKEMEQIKDKEGRRILSKIKETQYVITLEIKGKQLTSEGLSEKMAALGLEGNSDVVFVIGGSLGLSNLVLNRSNFALSFSEMTFPHQLMKVVLLEQVYRGFRIMKGEPYHK